MSTIIKIERLDHQGRGIGYLDGKIVFVSNALLSEIVFVKITSQKKKIMEGVVQSYIEKSSIRKDVACPYYDECGGCDILHLSYFEQLIFKEKKVKDILNKYSGLLNVEGIVQPIVSGEQYFYRDKVTFQVDHKLGFFKENSNEIVSIDKCLLITESMNELCDILQSNMNFDDVNQVVMKDMGTGQIMLTIRLQKDHDLDYLWNFISSKVTSFYKCVHNRHNFIKGESKIIANLSNYKFLVSPSSFFQVNLSQTVKLYDKIVEYCDLNCNDSVLDLYCGAGTIGIYLSSRCSKVLGIELNPDAILDAKENQKLNKVSNIEFLVGDVKNVLSRTRFVPSCIVVDPPRSGLDAQVVKQILDISPKKLVYVSCDPMTLARDLRLLSSLYDVQEITPIDMFPNTHHVECVCILFHK